VGKNKYSAIKDAPHHGGARSIQDIYIPAVSPPKGRFSPPPRYSSGKPEQLNTIKVGFSLIDHMRNKIIQNNYIDSVQSGYSSPRYKTPVCKHKDDWANWYNPQKEYK